MLISPMCSVPVTRVALTALMKVPDAALENALAATPSVVGAELARQINEYVQKEGLGYYPALEYFETVDGAIDPDLFEAAQGISWFVLNVARSEVLHRLRSMFAHVEMKDIRLVAYTMPTIRPYQLNALHDLARHYTPDVVKVVLQLASLGAQEPLEDCEQMAQQAVQQGLKGHFDGVTVTSTQVI